MDQVHLHRPSARGPAPGERARARPTGARAGAAGSRLPGLCALHQQRRRHQLASAYLVFFVSFSVWLVWLLGTYLYSRAFHLLGVGGIAGSFLRLPGNPGSRAPASSAPWARTPALGLSSLSGPPNLPSWAVAASPSELTIVEMSSSQQRNGERMIHQDFLARIRFSNTLPPPPVPPKLLDIPNTGLASGQYTNPGFASRLARDQPLNIEADAELGMPLDLVGMPGIFDGDESAIQAPANPPPIHPHDRALLRPLATLGKPKVAETHVSFLRRTEYIATTIKQPTANIFLKPSSSSQSSNQQFRRPEKRKAASPEPDKGTPAYVKRKIEKSFDIAQANLKDRTRVKHPSNKSRQLRCVDAFPLLPDLDAFPDSGAYVTVKFTHNPVPSSSHYDTRLLSGIFKPIQRTDAEEQAYEAAQMAHERDPENVPRPNNMMNYEFYLPADTSSANSFRRRFDVDDPERDSDSLYPKNRDSFEFKRIRAYETAQETELDHESKFSDELILAINDEDRPDRERAVFYYPIMQRSIIRSQRTRNIARTMGGVPIEENLDTVDQLDVTVEEPDEELKRHMAKYKDHPFGFEDEEEEVQPHDDDDEEANGRQRSPVSEGERDADGEEDEE